MVVASVFERGPETCLKYNTVNYLEMTTHRRGDAAVEACEESTVELDREQPTEVEVSEVDVDDDSATAVVVFEGSILDGQKLRTGFAKRDGHWKYDDWLGFVDLEAERLIFQIGREGMLQAETTREAEAIACVVGGMEGMTAASLEKEIFESSEPLIELWDNCNRGSAST